MKKILAVILVTMLVMTTVAFAEGSKTVKIGMSMANNDDFTTQLEAKYQAAAEALGGIDLTILNAQSDANKQLADVESLISMGMDVIVIRCVDADASVPACEAVKNAGIYLVIDGASSNTDIYDVFVTFDQIEHGLMLGEYLQKWLDADPSRVAKMGYIYGVISPVIEGRRSGIFESAPTVQELVNGVASWSGEKAMALTEDWLLAYPDLNVIACANDEMAGGAIQAINAAGRQGEILVLGVDGTQTGQDYIRSGEMAATTFQDLNIQAKEIIRIAKGLVNGEKFDKEYQLKMLSLMTTDTIDEILSAQ